MLRTGRRAPDFDLARLDQGNVHLKELLKDGPVLLAFFKASCPVCQLTLPFLERIHSDRKVDAYRVYGISQDDPETAREFNKEYGITLPMLLDTAESGYPASNDYGISHVPSLFLIEADGTVGWSQEGFNKREMTALGRRAGVKVFGPGDDVPEWKAG